ncbi:hypothetical protein K439DRAFT_1660842 [Ramaria rubella]|nr:hypothetical protein K439DRAFT_1660842 [Ramaria rubella]
MYESLENNGRHSNPPSGCPSFNPQTYSSSGQGVGGTHYPQQFFSQEYEPFSWTDGSINEINEGFFAPLPLPNFYPTSGMSSDIGQELSLLPAANIHDVQQDPENTSRSQHAWIQVGSISTANSLSQFILPVSVDNVTSFLCGWKNCKHPVGFTQKAHLVTHLRAVHLREKPFRCIKCGTSFARKQEAVRHVNSLNDGKKYKCSFCYRAFARKTTRDNHEDICTVGKQRS